MDKTAVIQELIQKIEAAWLERSCLIEDGLANQNMDYVAVGIVTDEAIRLEHQLFALQNKEA